MSIKPKVTTKETKTKESREKPKTDDFPAAYIRLRTVLDSMEFIAMRYFLKDDNETKRIRRARELEKELMPIIKKFTAQIREDELIECPEGSNDCGGCCVSYPCP